jgi:hypothetical protein
MIGFSISADTRKLQELIRNHRQEVTDRLDITAFEGERYVKSHMSSNSPSAPGQPPAVVIGNLVGSINVTPDGNLTRNINVGADYGIHLEYGTSKMAARPFMGPMAMWLEGEIPRIWRGILEE